MSPEYRSVSLALQPTTPTAVAVNDRGARGSWRCASASRYPPPGCRDMTGRLAGCFLSFNFSQKNEKDRNCQRSFEADMGDVHTVMRSPWDLFPEISFPTIAPDLIDRHASSFVARPQLRTTKWRSMGGLWPHIQFPLSRIPFFFSFSAEAERHLHG